MWNGLKATFQIASTPLFSSLTGKSAIDRTSSGNVFVFWNSFIGNVRSGPKQLRKKYNSLKIPQQLENKKTKTIAGEVANTLQEK